MSVMKKRILVILMVLMTVFDSFTIGLTVEAAEFAIQTENGNGETVDLNGVDDIINEDEGIHFGDNLNEDENTPTDDDIDEGTSTDVPPSDDNISEEEISSPDDGLTSPDTDVEAGAKMMAMVGGNLLTFPDKYLDDFIMMQFGEGERITVEQAKEITELDLQGKNIANLYGIEYFENLEVLNCADNELTSLDVSKNMKLKVLNCANNRLRTLNVTGCPIEGCSEPLCPISRCPNTELLSLNCSNNQLGALTVTKNPKLTDLDCSNNSLTTLNIEKNIELVNLNIRFNELMVLTTIENKKLKWLDVSNNLISGSPHLNQNTMLEYYDCSNNRVSSIGFMGNPELLYVNCEKNIIRTMTLTNNPKLITLNCSDNRLTLLDITNNVSLETLNCSINQLTSINISQNTALQWLDLSYNRLPVGFDISNNERLSYLDCRYNYLPDAERERFEAVPECVFEPQAKADWVYLRYDRNGADENIIVPDPVQVAPGSSVLVQGNFSRFVREGHVFLGWNTEHDGSGTNYKIYSPPFEYMADRITVTRDTTLYANWLRWYPVEEIQIPDSLELKAGENKMLTATVLPENASDQSVKWTSSNPAVATVSEKGLVRGIGKGIATITATANDAKLEEPVSAGCTVEVLNIHPVSGISLNKTEVMLRKGDRMPLTATVSPVNATDKTVLWTSSAPGIVIIEEGVARAKNVGAATITATTVCGEFTADITVEVRSPLPDSLSLTPSYSIAKAGDRVPLHLTLNPVNYDRENNQLQWYLDGDIWDNENPVFEKDEMTLTVKENAKPGIYRLSAAVRGIIPNGSEGILNADTIIEVYATENPGPKLLESAVTVNPAKEDGVMLPIRIIGSEVFEQAKEDPGKANVRLYQNNGDEITMDGDDIWAELVDNARSIEVKAGLNAKTGTIKKVKAVIEAGGYDLTLEGTLNITVKITYPKLTFTTSRPLNAFYPGSTATLKAESADGASVVIKNITAVNPNSVGIPLVGPRMDGLTVASTGAKAGSYRFTIECEVEGYNAVSSTGKVTAAVKVISDPPKLKLSKSTVTIDSSKAANTDGVTLQILPASSRKKLEDWGEIAKVELWNARNNVLFIYTRDLKVNKERGEFTLPQFGDETTGRYSYSIRVYFKNKEGVYGKPVKLPLTIKWSNYAKTKPTFRADIKTITVNTNHIGDIATVNMTPEAANLEYENWQIVKGTLPKGIACNRGKNSLSFYGNGEEIKVNDSNITGNTTVEINALNGKGEKIFKDNIKIIFKITDKQPTFSLTTKGSINLVNSAGAVTVTAKLNHTTSRIAAVELYNSTEFTAGDENTLFEVVEMAEGKAIEGGVFHIRAKGGVLTTGKTRHKLFVKIYLENQSADNILTTTRAITITPVQTTAKAGTSRNNVILYREKSDVRQELTLSLTSSVEQTLDFARLAQDTNTKRKFKDGTGFELVRTGKDTWAIGFIGGKSPEVTSGSLKSSYTLTLELWPHGTFSADENGNYKEAYKSAKPATVNIKVYVR